MAPSNLRGIASAAAVFALLAIFIWGLSRLLQMGGKPEQQGLTARYRVKQTMRVLTVVFALFASSLIWFGVKDLGTARHQAGYLMIAIGGVFLAMAFFAMLPCDITLDQAGIEYRPSLRQPTTISWHDLDHYETVVNPRGMTTNYYLRGKSGATITIPDTAYDIVDILERIQHRQPIPHQPYKRRRWYGG